MALTTPDYVFGAEKLPRVSASASRNAAGKIHLSLVNLHPNEPITIATTLEGVTAKSVSGRILTGPEMNSRNTFESPDAVKPATFAGATLANGKLTLHSRPNRSWCWSCEQAALCRAAESRVRQHTPPYGHPSS